VKAPCGLFLQSRGQTPGPIWGDPGTILGRPREPFGQSPAGTSRKPDFLAVGPGGHFRAPSRPGTRGFQQIPGRHCGCLSQFEKTGPGAGKQKSARSGRTNANFPNFLVLFVPARSRYHFRVQLAALSANPLTTSPGDNFSVSRGRFAQLP